MERASIDEAYLDLTEEAAKLFQGTEAEENQDMANVPETDLQVHVLPRLMKFTSVADFPHVGELCTPPLMISLDGIVH